MQDTQKQLWDIIYREFEQTAVHSMNIVLAMGQDRSEMQHRLLRAVGALKTTDKSDFATAIEQIRADILLANANGWVSDQTSDRAQDLLDACKASA